MKIDRRLLFLSLLLMAGALVRLLPHPWGFTPIGAMALLGGAKSGDRPLLAFGLPLGALLLSDLLMGAAFHDAMPVVYASFAICVVIGLAVGRRRSSPAAVATGAAGSATLFFLTTNFWVWTATGTYPPTGWGLAACYAAGLPFYATHLAGDLLYATALFGVYAALERREPALEGGIGRR
ncbi:MAG TPA: DUF6580 family putative transport protein [Thermoanaerobaculia bacterium]|nr:DUF6580 family putative transport protein [Thermoanaerobaculia bacterium]